MNAPEELSDLVGAKILAVDVRHESYDDSSFARLHVRYRKGLTVNESTEGYYEFWRDEEGNGPGYLAFMGTEKEA